MRNTKKKSKFCCSFRNNDVNADDCGDLGDDSLLGCDGFNIFLYDSDNFDNVNNGVEAVNNDNDFQGLRKCIGLCRL